ncbi:hypothetical protein ACM26V_03425 [Salipaludibacillus sp. HK11]|uniref:hypothetical protein n=1 Tax=Salipaludibacillus sp. HK11 TaxID=3394320 RepID=UPI0039FDB5DC
MNYILTIPEWVANRVSFKGVSTIKVNDLISWINTIRVILTIFILWLYIDSLILKGNYKTLLELQVIGNTSVVIPDFTPYQFTIIQTIPLFILVLIGTERFITILKHIQKEGTVFDKKIIHILRKLSALILFFGAIKTLLNILGSVANLLPHNAYGVNIVVYIFPIDYVVGFIVLLGFTYILNLGIKLEAENNMSI